MELLAAGCLLFGEANRQASKLNIYDEGINPFISNLTVSSFCNTLYRRNFMPLHSIPWIPANGYNPHERTSIKADKWLKFVSESENVYIISLKKTHRQELSKKI